MTSQENYKVSSSGYYGKYGGAFVPEMLLPNILELQENYLEIISKSSFKKNMIISYEITLEDLLPYIWHSVCLKSIKHKYS